MQGNRLIRRCLPSAIAIVMMALTGPAPADEAPKGEKIPDDEIVSTIKSDLTLSKGVSANRIEVASNGGIVKLTGSVDNILAKERAARLARSVKGVRSVVNNVEVRTTDRTDQQITNDAVAALAEDPATESWQIGVEVTNGHVTLTGEVDSHQEKELAATVVKGVRGVRAVANKIRVTYDNDRTDDEIKAEIERRVMWDVRVNDALIDVKVKDGRVTLSGTVGSAQEKAHARSLAWVTGVRSVDAEDLEVEWWARDEMDRKSRFADKSDKQIRNAVERAFSYDPRLKGQPPEVDVDGGVVTLRGTVGDAKAKRAAAQDARNTVGVWRVKNRIDVKPSSAVADTEIERDVEDGLLRDPYVDRHQVTVTVDDGVVELHGDVDSYFEKSQAEEVAASVVGVTRVENHLDVGYEEPGYSGGFSEFDPITSDYDFDTEGEDENKSDWAIRNDIEDELWWSARVNAADLDVKVDNGVATITGTVDSWSEREAVTQNAYEGGAKNVINNVTVEFGPEYYQP